MPEEPNSSENPTSPEETAEFPETEWSDELDYQSPEESTAGANMAAAAQSGGADDEAPNPTDDAVSAATPELTETEWSDDSDYEALEPVPTAAATPENVAATEEWDEATFEWDDELADPPEAPPQPPTTTEALTWLQPAWRRFRRLWQRLIAGVRNRIPAVANFPDAVLSGIIVGILVLLLIVLNSVRQPSVASSPPSPQPAEPEVSASPAESPPSAVAVEDDDALVVAEPVSSPTPNEPAPALVDSDRIAKIQAQMTDSSILNAQRVIDSVQADFTQNQLTLIFNADWYRLSDYDQTQLAQALMQQSQALEFANIQCLTPDGEVLARSPVVGNNIVILQRERPPEVPEPERPRFRIMIDR